MNRQNQIQNAVEILNQGGIIIYPTDTAYAIGCRMDNTEAVNKLFYIRKRPKNQAVPVLMSSVDMVKEYVEPFENDVKELMDNYWPGQLTIILPAQKSKVPELVMGGGTTLGVRVPDHSFSLNIITRIGVPILGPSANFSSERTPYKYAELDQDLVKLVDFVVFGEPLGKKVSTVIDCSSKPWKILRQGELKINTSK